MTLDAPKIGWLETSVGSLAWQTDGPQGGIPLVLLQRFRGTMDDWDPSFIEEVSRDRRVIRFDSAGIGRSSGSVPDSISGMAAVAAEFIRTAGFYQVDVLGWSLGGVVSQQLALDFPSQIRRLIIAGSSPGPLSEGPQQHPRVPKVMTKVENDENDFLFLFYPDSDSAVSAGRGSLSRIANQLARGPKVTAEAFMAQVKAIATWPGVLHRINELRMPMLVANGALDIMLPAYRSYVLSQQAKDAKLILYPDAGHAFLFQYIEDFVSEIDLFLS